MPESKGVSKDRGFVLGLISGLAIGMIFFNLFTGLLQGLGLGVISAAVIGSKENKEVVEKTQD